MDELFFYYFMIFLCNVSKTRLFLSTKVEKIKDRQYKFYPNIMLYQNECAKLQKGINSLIQANESNFLNYLQNEYQKMEYALKSQYRELAKIDNIIRKDYNHAYYLNARILQEVYGIIKPQAIDYEGEIDTIKNNVVIMQSAYSDYLMTFQSYIFTYQQLCELINFVKYNPLKVRCKIEYKSKKNKGFYTAVLLVI